MSDENQNVVEPQNDEIDYKAFYEEHAETIQNLPGLIEKNKKLLDEAKQAKAERERAQKAEQEKAVQNQEYEKLWKTSQQERDQLEQILKEKERNWRTNRVETNAMQIAAELADGTNAKLLAKFVFEHLDKLADETGSLSDDVLKAVKKEFNSNDIYKVLLRSTKAAGGGAQGNTNNAAGHKSEMTQSEIDALPPAEKVRLLQSGVKVVPNHYYRG